MTRESKKEVTGCAWCGRIRRRNGHWTFVRSLTSPDAGSALGQTPTTHGICPECYDRERAKMRAQLLGQVSA